jgi:hypothetical protein
MAFSNTALSVSFTKTIVAEFVESASLRGPIVRERAGRVKGALRCARRSA